MHSHPASRLHSYLTMQQSVEGDQNTPRIVLTIATTSAFISVLVRVRQEVLEEGSSTIASWPLWTTWMEMEFVDERDCYTYVLFIKKGSWCRSISILSLWVLFYIIIIYHHQTCWLTQYCLTFSTDRPALYWRHYTSASNFNERATRQLNRIIAANTNALFFFSTGGANLHFRFEPHQLGNLVLQ